MIKNKKKVRQTISLFQARAAHSFRRYLSIMRWLILQFPFDGTSACISWRANSQCSARSHEHNPSGASFQIHLPLCRIQDVRSPPKWNLTGDPSGAPNITSFTYPTSPVYTLPIYHQRQLHRWLSERAKNINQAHLTEDTGIWYQKPASPCVCGAKTYVFG